MFIYAQDESMKGVARGEGGSVARGNNCQGSFLCNICILTPFYASCGYDSPFPLLCPALPRLARAAAAHLPCGLSGEWNQTASRNCQQGHGKGAERQRVRWCDVEGRVQRVQTGACSILQHFVLISHFWKVAAATWTRFWCCPARAAKQRHSPSPSRSRS